jgi:hypothetical protein
MAKKVRFWWMLLIGWLFSAQPVAHIDGAHPSIIGLAQDHDPHAESEQPSPREAQQQGTEIAPPPRPYELKAGAATYRYNVGDAGLNAA